jgi:hypothetical protein
VIRKPAKKDKCVAIKMKNMLNFKMYEVFILNVNFTVGYLQPLQNTKFPSTKDRRNFQVPRNQLITLANLD